LNPLNLLQNLKAELGCFSKKRVGKMGSFFVHVVGVEKTIELQVKDTGVKGANTPSMISRIDGLTCFVSPA
jgi:hypothetical protein